MNIKLNNGILYLTPEIAEFSSNGDFLALDFKADPEKLRESELDPVRVSHYDRVRLRRAFPFSLADEYISVQDPDGFEIGLVEKLADFPEHEQKLVADELARVYYCPEIERIISMRERMGYTYLKVVIDGKVRELTLKDPYKCMVKINGDRMLIFDNDQNRCMIRSLAALDKKSRKKIDMYL